jgi:hypothetical protein
MSEVPFHKSPEKVQVIINTFHRDYAQLQSVSWISKQRKNLDVTMVYPGIVLFFQWK